MAIEIEVPGRPALQLEHLVLDVNGTLTDRGTLAAGVGERLSWIAPQLRAHLVSADTFGNLDALAAELGVQAERISTGSEKLAYVERLGAARCVAIGNGANDAAMLDAVGLGIAVLGPEGAAASALVAADVVCRSITEALDLLLDERALLATLRP